MLRNSFFLMLLVTGIFLSGCNSEQSNVTDDEGVPVAVKNQFGQQFQKSSDVKWDSEEGNYEAEFTENGVSKTVVYDAQGNWIETEIEIETEMLPDGIFAYLDENFPGTEIEGAEKIENQEGEFYEVEIEDTNDAEVELIFDTGGILVNSVVEDESGEMEDGEEAGEQETALDIAELPAAVTDYIAANYVDYTILEADMETTSEGSFIDVELESSDGTSVVELVFDGDGNFIKIEEDDDD